MSVAAESSSCEYSINARLAWLPHPPELARRDRPRLFIPLLDQSHHPHSSLHEQALRTFKERTVSIYSQLHNLYKPHQAHQSFYMFIYAFETLFHTLSYVKEKKYISVYIHPYVTLMFEIQRVYLHRRALKLQIELKSSITSKLSTMSKSILEK